MELSNNVISQFVKITNDNKTKEENTKAYGTVVILGDEKYVRLDGSDLLTPVGTTTEIQNDERVTVSIKNHSAIITGNTTSPSVGIKTMDGFRSEITQTAEQIRMQVEDNAGNISSLTQRANELDLTVSAKVDADSIISTINMSSEGIKIASNKIAIEGVVTFSDLETPGKTTISGSNITSGTITGTRLKTANLTSTTGVAIETNSVKIGSAGLFFEDSAFRLECSLPITIGSLHNITIMPGLNSNGTTSGNGQVNIPDALLNAQKLRVVDHADIYEDLYVGGTSILSGSVSTGSDLTVADTILIKLGSVWAGTVNQSLTGAYVKMGTGGYMLAYNGFHFINSAGDAHTLRAGTIYSNGSVITSDKRKKTDIRYVNVDKQRIGESGKMAPNMNITTQDMHEFIDSLPIASFRYTEEVNNDRDFTHYGFLTQDIMYTKVGSELVSMLDEDKHIGDEDDFTGYNLEKLVMFMCGALQEEIKARKVLEEFIKNKLS